MALSDKRTRFPGRIVILGFGSIGQGVLPLILRHIDIEPSRYLHHHRGRAGPSRSDRARRSVHPEPADPGRTMPPSSSRCWDRAIFSSTSRSRFRASRWSNSAKARARSISTAASSPGPAAIPTQACRRRCARTTPCARTRLPCAPNTGADRPRCSPTAPIRGLVSHFVKQALLNIAADTGVTLSKPSNRQQWGELAHRLGVRVIHVAERDTQVSAIPKERDEFVNTWSIEGFVGEGAQPAELGWGSHERHFPPDGGRHAFAPAARSI